MAFAVHLHQYSSSGPARDEIIGEYIIDVDLVTYAETPTPTPTPTPLKPLSDWLSFSPKIIVANDSANSRSSIIYENLNFNYSEYPFKEYNSELSLLFYKDSYTGSMWDLYTGSQEIRLNRFTDSSLDYIYEYDVDSQTTVSHTPAFDGGFYNSTRILKQGGTPYSLPSGGTYINQYIESSVNSDFDTWLAGNNFKIGVVLWGYEDGTGTVSYTHLTLPTICSV